MQEEVRNLKLCLQSADKELLEVKNELVKEKTLSQTKRNELFEMVYTEYISVCPSIYLFIHLSIYMSIHPIYLSKIGGLEQELAAETGKYERTLVNLQTLQVSHLFTCIIITIYMYQCTVHVHVI